jgi:hypothetical protein
MRNAASQLRREVEVLLEMMADAAADFELLIVDLGSTDHSQDVVEELAREFRHIRGMRKPAATGLKAFIDEIRSRATGQVIVHGGLSEAIDLERQWLAPPPDPALPVLTKGPKNLHSRLLGRLGSWGEELKGKRPNPAIQPRPAGSFVEHLRALTV